MTPRTVILVDAENVLAAEASQDVRLENLIAALSAATITPECRRTSDTGHRRPLTAKQSPALGGQDRRRPSSTGLARNAQLREVRRDFRVLVSPPCRTNATYRGSRTRAIPCRTSDSSALSTDIPNFCSSALRRATNASTADSMVAGTALMPMGHFPVYQVLLRGPTKIEYLFLDRSQDPLPPLEPSGDTLPAINTHFWDWIWWLATKSSVGRNDLVAENLPQLHAHLLRPMGVAIAPESIDAAIEAFVARRDALERDYGVSVPRPLEDEVRRGISRIEHGISSA